MTHGLPALPEGEVGGLVQDLAEVDGGVDFGQLQGQAVGLGQAFVEGEGHDLEVGGADGEGEAQIGLGGHAMLPAGHAPRHGPKGDKASTMGWKMLFVAGRQPIPTSKKGSIVHRQPSSILPFHHRR